jgi:hypothetical protein
LDPVIKTVQPVYRVWVKLTQNNDLVENLTKSNIAENKFLLKGLTPFTKYETSIAIGNVYGFGDKTSIMFTTSQAGEIQSIVD